MVEEDTDSISCEKESETFAASTSNIESPGGSLATQTFLLNRLSYSHGRARLGSLGSSFDSDCESLNFLAELPLPDLKPFNKKAHNYFKSQQNYPPSFEDLCSNDNPPMAEYPSASSTLAGEPQETWYFEFPQDLCGRLIGKKGHNINTIKQLSGAAVYVTKAWSHVMLRTIKITGTVLQIRSAVDIIEGRFPGLHLRRISNVRVLPVVEQQMASVKVSQIQLALNIETEVIIPSVLDAGHFYVQLHSTATQSVLNGMQMDMGTCYEGKGQVKHLPSLPCPPVIGTYCAARADEGWLRAQLVDVFDDGVTANIVCVDYGCYYKLPFSSLKQLRSDFFRTPFQAVECHLANVVPLPNEMTYSVAATHLFEKLTQGKVIQAIPRSYRNGIPCLELFTLDEAGQLVFINSEMVDSKLVRWSNAPPEEVTTPSEQSKHYPSGN